MPLLLQFSLTGPNNPQSVCMSLLVPQPTTLHLLPCFLAQSTGTMLSTSASDCSSWSSLSWVMANTSQPHWEPETTLLSLPPKPGDSNFSSWPCPLTSALVLTHASHLDTSRACCMERARALELAITCRASSFGGLPLLHPPPTRK